MEFMPPTTYNLLLRALQRLRIARLTAMMWHHLSHCAHAVHSFHRYRHISYTFTDNLPYRLQECIPEIGRTIRQYVHLFRSTLQLRSQVNQFPQEMRIHVLGGRCTNLHFGNRNQHLVSDDFHFVLSVFT